MATETEQKKNYCYYKLVGVCGWLVSWITIGSHLMNYLMNYLSTNYLHSNGFLMRDHFLIDVYVHCVRQLGGEGVIYWDITSQLHSIESYIFRYIAYIYIYRSRIESGSCGRRSARFLTAAGRFQ